MRCTPKEEAFLRELPDDLLAEGWKLIACGRPSDDSNQEREPRCTVVYKWPGSDVPISLNTDSVETARDSAVTNMRSETFRVRFEHPRYRIDVNTDEIDLLIPEEYKHDGWTFAFIAGEQSARGVADWTPWYYYAVLTRGYWPHGEFIVEWGFEVKEACDSAIRKLQGLDPHP